MIKKIKLNDLGKKIESFTNPSEVKKYVEVPQLDDLNAPITFFSYYGKGSYEYSYYCPSCNEIVMNCKNFTTYGRYKCPKCGITHEVCEAGGTFIKRSYVNSSRNNKEFYYIKEIDTENKYAIISSFNISYTHTAEDSMIMNDGILDFLKMPYKENIYINNRDFIFSLEFGIRFYDYSSTNQTLSVSTNDYNFRVRKFQKEAMFIKNKKYEKFIQMLKDFNSKVFESVDEYYEKNGIKSDSKDIESMVKISNDIINSRKRTVTRKPKKAKGEEFLNIQLEELTAENITVKHSRILTIRYESAVKVDKLIHFCPCGCHWKTEQEGGRAYVSSETIVCPKCGKHSITNNVETGYENSDYWVGVKYEYSEELNRIIARYFSVSKNVYYDIETDVASEKYHFREYKRLFINTKGFDVTENDIDWKYITTSKACIGSNLHDRNWTNGECSNCVNTKEELANIISKSDFSKSGLLEAWGILENSYVKPLEPVGFISNDSYIAYVIHHPFIEQIYKSGLSKATKDLLSNTVYYVPPADTKTVCEILKINTPVFKIAKKINADFNTIREIQELWEADQTLNIEVFQRIKSFNLKNGYKKMVEIKKQYNIRYLDQLNYIKNCYDHQCIHYQESLNIWCDYLRMAFAMKYKMKDSKYPDSLKKEHDRALFSYEVVKDKIMHETFVKQSEINSVYEYDEDEKFMVVVPKEPEDIISEGKSLKHCVSSYVESVRNGKTVICFIRKKESPEESFFTSEILNGQIYQVKGYTNELPKDEELLMFINNWARNKNLTIEHF